MRTGFLTSGLETTTSLIREIRLRIACLLSLVSLSRTRTGVFSARLAMKLERDLAVRGCMYYICIHTRLPSADVDVLFFLGIDVWRP